MLFENQEDREIQVASFSPWDVAEGLREHWFTTPGVENVGGLLEWYGTLFTWTGHQWRVVDLDDLKLELWRSLQRCVFLETTNDGVARTVKPTDIQFVSNVLQALRAQTQLRVEHEPAWLRDKDDKPSAKGCWAFEDVLVDVWATAAKYRESGEYEWVTMDRDASFFTTSVLPCGFDPNTLCPVWERVMNEWSGDDEQWKETRERFYGYAVWGERPFDRWLMEFGQTRGGKGTAVRFLKRVLGHPAYFGTDMQQLGDRFGVEGLQRARVLVIEEAEDMDKGRGSRVARVIKQVTGGGAVQIEKKGVDAKLFEVKVPSILQSNPPITLPDDKRGLSAKAVALRFDHSFVKNSDPKLDEKLWAERQGILARWLKALVRLVAVCDDAEQWFPMPESSLQVLRDFELADNPWEAFLAECCEESPKALVSNEKLRKCMRGWEALNGQKFLTRRGKYMSNNHLVRMLCEQSSYPLKPTRVGRRGEQAMHTKGLKIVRDLSTWAEEKASRSENVSEK